MYLPVDLGGVVSCIPYLPGNILVICNKNNKCLTTEQFLSEVVYIGMYYNSNGSGPKFVFFLFYTSERYYCQRKRPPRLSLIGKCNSDVPLFSYHTMIPSRCNEIFRS